MYITAPPQAETRAIATVAPMDQSVSLGTSLAVITVSSVGCWAVILYAVGIL